MRSENVKIPDTFKKKGRNPKTLKQGNNKGKKLKVDCCPDIVVHT